MAYAYPDDNGFLLKRTVTGFFEFSGRSRRTEVLYYWIACALVSVVLQFTVSTLVSFEASLLFAGLLKAVLSVPSFALFVRRLHDQGKAGWWGIFLPLSMLFSIPGFVAELRGDVTEAIAQKSSVSDMVSGVCGLVVLVLILWRGSTGHNRYGPDPRVEVISAQQEPAG